MTFLNSLRRAAGAALAPFLFAAMFWAAAPAQGQINGASPALWKLTDEDSEVWLFGTVHILDPNLSWHSQKVNDAFNAADILILEAPVLETPPVELQQIVLRYARNQAGVTLSSLLSPEGNAKLIETIVSFGIPEAQAQAMKQQFDPLRPWFVYLQLAAMQAQAMGADPAAGVETVLTEAAKGAGKNMQYLETVEQQFRFFADLTQEEETKMLEEALVQALEQPDLLNILVQDWLKGNADQVGETMQAALTDPVIYDTLLTNRNKDWAKQIKTIMDGSGTYFIAVGTGHLVGRNSVQDYLKLHGLEAVREQ